MRFYWFDGKEALGPFELEELLRKAGFSGESVVCPVGSADAQDWKPAVQYEILRDALFKPKPVLVSAPPPPLLAPCPSCRRDNPADAAFCNQCGQPMKAAPPKAAQPGIPPPAASPEPSPKPTSIAPPSMTPDISAGPRMKGPKPGGMGRIAQFQETQKAAQPQPSPVVDPPNPKAQETPPALPRSRQAALAAWLLGGIVMAAAGGYWWQANRKVPAPPAPPAAVSPPPAAPAPEPRPVAESPRPRPPAAAPEKPPTPTRAKASGGIPSAKPAPKKIRRPRRNAAAPPAAAGSPAPILTRLPGMSIKTSGLAPEAALRPAAAAGTNRPPAPPTADSLMADGAKDQFQFCHQLMRQGAFGEFYDSCLCAEARQAAPYNGRRKAFVADAAGRPDSGFGADFRETGTEVDGRLVSITAEWDLPGGALRRTERWIIEDGLWCRTR
ncbi:MAG: zinc ribbon domain-containing protein [Elusimicrobia bacterium]|nr:zinc ribbon domain-containing protein [Elusimicrobiota bacterium]